MFDPYDSVARPGECQVCKPRAA